MKKLYKNLTGKELKVKMYGLGEVVVPDGVFEMEESTVDAIQRMTYVKLFEEFVEEKFIPETLEAFTNKELRDMCEEQGIECSNKDNKTVLIAKLRGE